MKYPVDKLIIYDLEVYPNYFLFGCISSTGEYIQYDHTQGNSLEFFLAALKDTGHILCGFNSLAYDDVVLHAFLEGRTPASAYQTSKEIIEGGLQRWNTDCDIESVDLIKILPGRMSLKKLGVVLGHHKLQELPFDPHKPLTVEEMEVIRQYNINDLEITRKLLTELQPQLDLRATLSEQYNIDLRSSGEAQIAERILLEETGLRKKDLKTDESNFDFRIRPPSWWKSIPCGQTKDIGDAIFSRRFKVRDHYMPDFTRTVYLGDRYYKMGIGGLHSIDGPGCWGFNPDEDTRLGDWDITSQYPSLISTQNLSPSRWGDRFMPVYKRIVERRVAAKHAGDKVTADVMKIMANGTYGKLGDKYSPLYDPEMLMHVTIYGQLSLLLLIEMLTEDGHRVVSANTDGVTVLWEPTAPLVVSLWESLTSLQMEYVEYDALWQMNVNNYAALTSSGKLKTKGRLSSKPDLRKLPRALIVPKAVTEFLVAGTPPWDTVRNEKDITMFTLAGTVNRGWRTYCGDQELGKVLRWYRSTREDLAPIMKEPEHDGIKGNAGQVPYSENGVPADDLPDALPDDLDLLWYADQAKAMIAEISKPKLRGMNAFAEELIALGLQPNVVEKKKSLSRAAVEYGTVDFDSIPDGHHMVVRTGKGLIAELNKGIVSGIWKTEHTYPTKTRPKVEKDHGLTLVYGGSVPVPIWGLEVEHADISFDDYYTEAELRKVRG